MSYVIRTAQAGEASALSDLAMRSKAHWGYDAEFLERVRPLLTFSERTLVESLVGVLEVEGSVVGVYRVSGEPPEGELEDLWLDPVVIGQGFGRLLFEHAVAAAGEEGFESLIIEAEPNALGFYEAMGAVVVGERLSGSGRTLPLMRVSCA